MWLSNSSLNIITPIKGICDTKRSRKPIRFFSHTKHVSWQSSQGPGHNVILGHFNDLHVFPFLFLFSSLFSLLFFSVSVPGSCVFFSPFLLMLLCCPPMRGCTCSLLYKQMHCGKLIQTCPVVFCLLPQMSHHCTCFQFYCAKPTPKEETQSLKLQL